ncbi:MAG: ATP-binding protein [Patescibacteria group bacterium]|jgi:PAS domain S-box-containing protein
MKENKKVIIDSSIFKMAVDNAFNHIIITDAEGKIIYANKAVKKITHYDPKEILGKTPAVWGNQMPVEFYKKLWKTIKIKKKPFTGEVTNRRKNDGQYIAHAVISPILKHGKLVGFVGTEEDITKQKQIDKMKSDFISIASHELRTPLTAIKGFISMIFDGDYGKLNENIAVPLKDIQLAANRLIELVNNLLNVSRIEAGRMKFTLTDFDISPLVKEITELFQPISKQRNIQILSEGKTKYQVFADKEKVREIFNNLIGNALKFVDHGKITISMKKINSQKDLIFIYVKDTGIGIDPSDQHKLFNKFEQVSSQQFGRPQGSGLGLYISKLIAKKMSGDLWLENSEVKKGSTFAFSIPLSGTMRSIKSKLQIKSEADQHPDQK